MPTATAPTPRRSPCLHGSAITAALTSVLLSGEEVPAADLGAHLAMSFRGPGLITRARCDAYLAATEPGARPLSDQQWAAVHAAIARQLALVERQEREDAWAEGREEQEVAALEDLRVLGAAGRVAA